MIRRLILILASIACCGCGEKQANTQSDPDNPKTQRETLLSGEEFTRRFRDKIRELDPRVSVQIVRDFELRLSLPGKEQQTAFLDNAYKEYRQGPADLGSILERFATSSLESLRTAGSEKIDKTRIVPVIKDAAYPDEVRRSLEKRGFNSGKISFYYEKLNEHLLVFYAVDSERSIRYLRKDDVDSLGFPRANLRDKAIANLKRLLPKIKKQGNRGVFMVTAGGTYEASLLLFDSIWTKGTFKVDGDIVVAVPSRDVLLVTGAADRDGVEKVQQIVRETLSKGSYTLTGALFVRRKGRWVHFQRKPK